jgi:GT2 family glycosyltransferase
MSPGDPRSPGELWQLPDGRYVVPGNRADLLADRWPAEPPTVSVVIPYYRDQRRLDLVLAGLSKQTHPPTRLEVVVADDGSPDPPNVTALGRDLAVTVVRQSDDGFRAAAARNLGARAAQGEILCFLDGDTVPTSEYVRTLTRLPALLRDAVVTGHRRHADLTGATAAWVRNWLTGQAGPPPEIPEPQWLIDLHHRSNNLLHLDRHSYQAVISAVLGCPASLYAEVGGFDEAFTAYGGEDWEFGYRALNAGAVLTHEPGAVAWHDGADWGRRHTADPTAARAEKARETAALAQRIPGLDPAGMGPADVVVHLSAPPELGATAAAAYRTDPELDCSVVTTDADPAAQVRCRTQVWVTGENQLPPVAEVRDLVERVGPGRLGRATVTAPGQWRAVAVSTAALRRTARWQSRLESSDLLADLFGAEDHLR